MRNEDIRIHLEMAVMLMQHRQEQKNWREVLAFLARYLSSPAFIRPWLVTYVLFLIVVVVNVVTKMQDLRSIAESVGKRKPKTPEVRVITANEDTPLRSQVLLLSNQLVSANKELENLKLSRRLVLESPIKSGSCHIEILIKSTDMRIGNFMDSGAALFFVKTNSVILGFDVTRSRTSRVNKDQVILRADLTMHSTTNVSINHLADPVVFVQMAVATIKVGTEVVGGNAVIIMDGFSVNLPIPPQVSRPSNVPGASIVIKESSDAIRNEISKY